MKQKLYIIVFEEFSINSDGSYDRLLDSPRICGSSADKTEAHKIMAGLFRGVDFTKVVICAMNLTSAYWVTNSYKCKYTIKEIEVEI